MYRVTVQSGTVAPFGNRSLVPLLLSRRITIPLATRQIPFYIDVITAEGGGTEVPPSTSLARMDQWVGLQGPKTLKEVSSVLFPWQSSGGGGESPSTSRVVGEEFTLSGAASISNQLLATAAAASLTASRSLEDFQLTAQVQHFSSLLLSGFDNLFNLIFDSPDDLKTVVLAHTRLLDAVQDLDKWIGAYQVECEKKKNSGGNNKYISTTATTIALSSLVPLLHLGQQHFGLALGPYPHLAALLRESSVTPSLFENTGSSSSSSSGGGGVGVGVGGGSEVKRNDDIHEVVSSEQLLLTPKEAFQAVLDIEESIPTVAEHKAKVRATCPYGGVLTTVGEVVKVHHTIDPRETQIHHKEGSREREALKQHRYQARFGFQGSVSTVSWNNKQGSMPKQFGFNRSGSMNRKAMPYVDTFKK